jgi:hypothetical protein
MKPFSSVLGTFRLERFLAPLLVQSLPVGRRTAEHFDAEDEAEVGVGLNNKF